MNRHERRAAKKLNRGLSRTIYIQHNCLYEGEPGYGEQVPCYLCDAPHKARGIAVIDEKDADHLTLVPHVSRVLPKKMATPSYGDIATRLM
jgi:hypothetical protein